MNVFTFNGGNAVGHVSTNSWIRALFICGLIFVAIIGARSQNVPLTPIENSTLSWSLEDGTLTISGTGDMPDYNGSDMPWASYQSSITTAVIEDGVTYIGQTAFAGCTSLTSVTIPNSVTSIGDGAFTACSSLTSIDVADDNLYYTSENGVLFDKAKTTLIQYSAGKTGAYTIPNSVTSIGVGAFSGCSGLTSVTIPNSVTFIGVGAFSGCSGLTSVIIPNSVTSIGFAAFYGCSGLTSVIIGNLVSTIDNAVFNYCTSLSHITVDEDNMYYASVDGILFDKAKTDLIRYPEGKTDTYYNIPSSVTIIGEGAFEYCSNLTSVTIPNSVITIGSLAFYQSNLTSIYIPNSVTTISSCAFTSCNGLTSVSFPNSVLYIGYQAFQNCSSLKSVSIHNSAVSIEGLAFENCIGLTEIVNYAIAPQLIGSDVFGEVEKSQCILRVPLGSSDAYRAADVWQDFGNIVEFVAIPHYTAVTQPYPDNMTVTAAVVLNGTESQSDHIEIGAFCGDECRGSIVLQNYPDNTEHPYLGFLVVHGNDGDNITFRVFNHDTDKEYDATNAPISFAADAINGDPTAPYLVDATDIYTQTIPLVSGWSWVSVNIADGNPSLLDQFKTSVGAAGNLLKGKNEFIQTPGWIGTLSSIDNRNMYMVNTTAAGSLSFTGLQVNPVYTPISLLSGWNWIGYLPQASLSIDDALAGMSPQDGDQIKSRSEYSSYTTGTGWVGTLETMNPGDGFKYFSTSDQALVYPSTSSQFRSVTAENDMTTEWTPNANSFPNTMTMTSVVLSGSTELQSDQIEIGAFSGDECRGSALLKNFPQLTDHPYLGFLVVYGNGNEAIRLRIYNHATGQVYDASNAPLSFSSDAIYGSPSDPYSVVMPSPTGICNLSSGSVSVYMDQTGEKLNISYPWNVIDQVAIVDLTGRIVWQTTGFASESVNVSSLAKGAYIVKLVKDGQMSVYKFVKK